jgi:hypothetical protein
MVSGLNVLCCFIVSAFSTNMKKVKVEVHFLYSDAPPVIVNYSDNFLKNIEQYACGYQAGRKLDY